MAERVAGKVAVVVGAGQTPGETIGNGRATALLLALGGCAGRGRRPRPVVRSGDRRALIHEEHGEAIALQADATREAEVSACIATAVQHCGRLDILHGNVGASIALGDARAIDIAEDAFDRSFAVNLKTASLASKHAIPIMREPAAAPSSTSRPSPSSRPILWSGTRP